MAKDVQHCVTITHDEDIRQVCCMAQSWLVCAETQFKMQCVGVGCLGYHAQTLASLLVGIPRSYVSSLLASAPQLMDLEPHVMRAKFQALMEK